VGMAKLLLGDDDQAVNWLRRSVETFRGYSSAHFWLAAALANAGRMSEAVAAAESGLALDPRWTITRARAVAFSDSAKYLAQRERFYDGMRKAGVPEG
jgi:tetratricopeptide (TPR) repeat protein